MKTRGTVLAAALAWLFAHSPLQAHELELELAAQTLATVSVDERTRGGGVGLALVLGAPLAKRWLGTPGLLVAQVSVGALTGRTRRIALWPWPASCSSPSGATSKLE